MPPSAVLCVRLCSGGKITKVHDIIFFTFLIISSATMYKNARCEGKIVVLPVKPIAFLPFSPFFSSLFSKDNVECSKSCCYICVPSPHTSRSSFLR